MRSRSTVIFVMTKEQYVRSQLLLDFPSLLKDKPLEHEGAMFWRWADVRWDTRIPEVAAFFEYVHSLDEYEEGSEGTKPVFGGCELNDEGGDDSWGDPGHFGVFTTKHIESPFDIVYDDPEEETSEST